MNKLNFLQVSISKDEFKNINYVFVSIKILIIHNIYIYTTVLVVFKILISDLKTCMHKHLDQLPIHYFISFLSFSTRVNAVDKSHLIE
jgi:hypothetical protein